MPKIDVVTNASDAAIADWLANRLRSLFEREGPVTITVPGGSTPFPIFEALVQRDLPFDRLVIWPNDDRVVPSSHEASNAGRMRQIFEPVGADVVGLSIMEAVPQFDLTWLGMGADGHIASLFPNTEPQADDEQKMRRVTPDPLPPEAPFDRVTLTMPALLNTCEVVFVIRGDDKRAVFDAAANGEDSLPVGQFLRACEVPVTCFAD